MEKHEIITAIRRELVELYDDEQDIRRILKDVNIDPSRIAAGTSVENYWAEALTEAAKHNRIDNIVAVAIEEYPSKEKQLTWLLQEYYATHTKKREPSSPRSRSCSIVIAIGFLVVVLLFAITLQDDSVRNDIRALAQSLWITTPEPTILLCEFAFSVLDQVSEHPVSRAEVTVTIEQQQTTGVSNSTGYFSSQLPCTNPFPSANIRITADGYETHTEEVALVGEVKEILLSPIAEKTAVTPEPVPPTALSTATVTGLIVPTATATPSFTETATGTSTATPLPTPTATVTLIPTTPATPAPRSCPDGEGMAFVAGSNFCMDVTEVTNGDYQKCVAKGSCTAPSDDLYFSDPEKASYPVVYVKWDQAYGYCRDVLKRLPSSTEWQEAYAALNDETATLNSTREYSPVMSNPWDRSADQIFDLHGNVREWADDNFINPVGGVKSSNKYVMGDSFQSIQFPNESHAPETVDRGIGFRCVAYVN